MTKREEDVMMDDTITDTDLSNYSFHVNTMDHPDALVSSSINSIPFNMIGDSVVSFHALDILLKGEGQDKIKELTSSQILLLQWHLLDKVTEEYGGDSEEFAAACGCSTLQDMIDFINVLRL